MPEVEPSVARLPEFPGRLAGILSTYGFTEGAFIETFSKFRKTLRRFGVTATVPITGSLLKQHPGFIRKFRKNIEYALYGHLYQDYSRVPYETLRMHMGESTKLFSHYNLKPRGFRAPFLKWTDKTLDAMPSFDYIYESNNAILWDGVVVAKKLHRKEAAKYFDFQSGKRAPSLPSIEKGMVHIPVSLPNDQLLYHVWNAKGPQIVEDVFGSMLTASHEQGDLLVLDLHFDYFPDWHGPLENLLTSARKMKPPVWIAPCEEISRWWLERDRYVFDIKEKKDGYEIVGDVPNYATVLVRGAGTDTTMDHWFGRWKVARKSHFFVKCARIPGIGVPPGTPRKLIEFLKSEGFIVDESTGRDRFAIYIEDMYRFERNDGDAFRLLKRIEATYAPLIRLWRWPEKARSALAITANIEAITLGDFLRRKKE